MLFDGQTGAFGVRLAGGEDRFDRRIGAEGLLDDLLRFLGRGSRDDDLADDPFLFQFFLNPAETVIQAEIPAECWV